jgi:hypothetical protein
MGPIAVLFGQTDKGEKGRPTMNYRLMIVAALLALPTVGCGDGTSEPKLVPLSGTVTLNGKPLEGATIVFVPAQGNKEQTSATDITGAEGNYKAMTGSRNGVAPGRYTVIVEKPSPPAGPMIEGTDDDPYMASIIEKTKTRGKLTGVALKKGAKSKSSFDREVPESGGVIDLDLKHLGNN